MDDKVQVQLERGDAVRLVARGGPLIDPWTQRVVDATRAALDAAEPEEGTWDWLCRELHADEGTEGRALHYPSYRWRSRGGQLQFSTTRGDRGWINSGCRWGKVGPFSLVPEPKRGGYVVEHQDPYTVCPERPGGCWHMTSGEQVYRNRSLAGALAGRLAQSNGMCYRVRYDPDAIVTETD